MRFEPLERLCHTTRLAGPEIGRSLDACYGTFCVSCNAVGDERRQVLLDEPTEFTLDRSGHQLLELAVHARELVRDEPIDDLYQHLKREPTTAG